MHHKDCNLLSYNTLDNEKNQLFEKINDTFLGFN